MEVDTFSPTSFGGYAETYTTPLAMPQEVKSEMAPPSDPARKKRKAWGQPVPEINKILPPRKRAKTSEEKEQRKNERILRNRRAADKSRQRQKAAVADLEVKTGHIEQENALLRHALAQYQQRFGVLHDIPTSISTFSGPSELESAPSPFTLNDDADTPASSMSYPAYNEDQHPVFAPTAPPSVRQDSPTITPDLNTLDLDDNDNTETSAQTGPNSLASTSAMTRYPAAILCDLQCQAETGVSKLLSQPSFRLGFSHLLQLLQYLTIFQTFSTSTLLPMYQIFQILGQKLATNSLEQTLLSVQNSFPLIHSLISLPSTPTRPAIFRLKLLSRLLACSPRMARLLLAATDRALQQVVSDDAFAEDPDRRWTWASLTTIKWSILRLEKEHRRVRNGIQYVDHEIVRRRIMEGVDVAAVARSSRMWTEPAATCTNIGVTRHQPYEAQITIQAH